MDIRQLRYFLTICKEGQITAAAKKLHMAQPPLSQQLKALEEELGVTLIKRGNHHIILTDAGELLRDRAEQILQLMEQTQKEVTDAKRNTRKSLMIGIVSSSHNVFLETGLQEFHQDYPLTNFIVKEGNTFQVMDMLERGIIEIGIVRTPFSTTKFHVIPLAKEAMAAVVHRDCNPFSKDNIAILDLAEQPLMYYERFEMLLSEIFVENGFLPNVVCRSQDARTTLLWAKAKMGIAIVPEHAVTLVDACDLCVIPIEEERLSTQIMMITMKEGYLSDVAQSFLEYYQVAS